MYTWNADPYGCKRKGPGMTTEERLENLERELGAAKRRFRWLLIVIVLAVCALALAWTFRGTAGTVQAPWAGTAPNVIRANQFVVVDENGKAQATLRAGEVGPSLTLSDENGEVRATLSVCLGDPSLALLDANGNPRVILSLDNNGEGLALHDADGKPSASLFVDQDNGSVLMLHDEKGFPRAMLAVAKDGPGLKLWDEKFALRAALP